MKQHQVLTAVMVVLTLLAATAVAYEPGGSVLFALGGKLVQETVYTYTVTATPEPATSAVSLTVPAPSSHEWLWCRQQEIPDLQRSWSPQPSTESQETDAWGNTWFQASWSGLSEAVQAVVQATCREETSFGPIVTRSNRYTGSRLSVPQDVRQWLDPDEGGYIQSDAPSIRQLAQDISAGAMLQIEVVGRILAWVHDKIRMTRCDEPVEASDALWTLENQIGICVNFANLSVALLRAAGIPAVPVAGVVADAEAPGVGHAWIEVYFSDLGWFEFESSPWMPAYSHIPQTILTPHHITCQIADERGISSTPFQETHHCEIRIEQSPNELGFVSAEIGPGEAATWVLSVRSPSFYEIYEWEYGYRDLSVSLSLDGVPAGWHVDLSATDLAIPNQATGAAPTRSVMLTVRPAADAQEGLQHLITVTARDAAVPGTPVIGVLVAAVTVVHAP